MYDLYHQIILELILIYLQHLRYEYPHFDVFPILGAFAMRSDAIWHGVVAGDKLDD